MLDIVCWCLGGRLWRYEALYVVPDGPCDVVAAGVVEYEQLEAVLDWLENNVPVPVR